ncbi:MAG: SpiroCoCo family coiled-coil protein [Treponema sp.]
MQILSAAITLILCLILILFFRQADKNSRSIEKAKKYGDKLKDEIETYVKEQMQDLRNAAIEIETKLSQAIATVNRLDSINKEFMKKSDVLTARTAVIDKIEKTVCESEKTITTVMDMTALAEKNLARVSKESDFVETLAKKIAEARADLGSISKAVPEIEENFRRQNAEHLQVIEERVTAGFDNTINAFEARVAKAQKKSEELLEVTSIQLNELYKKAFTEAAKKAEAMEDELFSQLRTEAVDRIKTHEAALIERSAALSEDLQAGLSDAQLKIDQFTQELHRDADSIKYTLENQFSTVETELLRQLNTLQEEMHRIEVDIQNRQERLDNAAAALETRLETKMETAASATDRHIAALVQTSDSKFEEYKKQANYYYEKFDKSISNIDQLALEMEKAQELVKDRIMQELGSHTHSMQEKYNSFEKHFTERSEHLDYRIEDITKQLNQLRDDSYTHLSDKLHVFEKDFLADLTRKSDALSADIEKLRNDVAERLDLMGSESESARKDLEESYTQELKARLLQAQDAYKKQFDAFKDTVSLFEASITDKMEQNSNLLAHYADQFTEDLNQSKEKARLFIQTELNTLQQSLQEAVSSQRREVDTVTEQAQSWMDTVNQEAQGQVEIIKADFEAWKNRFTEQMQETKALVDEKIMQYEGVTDRAIESIGAKYNAQYKDFTIKGDESLKILQQKLNELQSRITSADEHFSTKVRETSDLLVRHSDQITGELDKKINEATAEAAHSLDSMRAVVFNLRAELDKTQHDAFEKVRSSTDSLTSVLNEIDKKQNAFIAQTRIFDRADELKAGLEQNIEKLKAEVSRFEIYRDAMDGLQLQYEKVSHLEEEAMQKIARFMGERKNIDLLETEFAKLTVLSDSMDKKIIELASANDDLQRYQVQIRRIEESIADVNTRYDRLEKKGVVLDQTVQSIDNAFENLKTIERDLKALQEQLYDLPPELKTIEEKMDYLVKNQEKAEKARRQLEAIDDLLSDMEVRIEKMHTAREWLAGTETRLQDIAKQSESQLKLLSDLLKAEKPFGKQESGGSSAPAIGTRENVLKLFRSGWKQDAIANALNLSQGEVELILELAEK